MNNYTSKYVIEDFLGSGLNYNQYKRRSFEQLMGRKLTEKENKKFIKAGWYAGACGKKVFKEWSDGYQRSLHNKPCSSCGKIADLSPAHLCDKCGARAWKAFVKAAQL